jgi:hypothetical protein
MIGMHVRRNETPSTIFVPGSERTRLLGGFLNATVEFSIDEKIWLTSICYNDVSVLCSRAPTCQLFIHIFRMAHGSKDFN